MAIELQYIQIVKNWLGELNDNQYFESMGTQKDNLSKGSPILQTTNPLIV